MASSAAGNNGLSSPSARPLTPPVPRVPAYPSLECLPNELLQPIAAGLVPSTPLTTRFALRPDGTWEFGNAGQQWAHWLAGHRDVLAFAQTSRRMAAVAVPLLYHTLVIRDAAALVALFRRMRRRPEIRLWMRDLTCLANVAGVLTIDALHHEWERQIGGAQPTKPLPR